MRELITSTRLHAPLSILRPNPPITIPASATVGSAIQLMKSKKIGCVLVVEGERLVGIFSERDVLTRVLSKNLNAESVEIRAVMTQDPECLLHEDSIAFALNRMSVGNYRHVPIVDSLRRPISLISVKNIFRYLLEMSPRTSGLARQGSA